MRRKARRLLCSLLTVGVAGCAVLLGWAWVDEHAMNYSRIEPGLYVGGTVSHPPRGTTVVINLCERRDEYEAPIHIEAPIRDASPAPTINWLRKMVQHIESSRQDGRTVYVHCRAGVSRSGLVVVAYLMHRDQCSLEDALVLVRKHRPQVRPNSAFMDLLREWEKTIGKD